MTVKILSSEIAEQIAAGEVVENPASVVKELVENSLDAGADVVEVSIQKGGIASIAVVDNGEGIPSAELPLIFERYATSKIARLEDLQAITSLGFRGEALPSIAAVSRLTLTSRRRGEPSAFRLRMDGGKPVRREEVGSPEGTAVWVEDLFYNTPARLNFLKSPPVEAGRISFLLGELSLAYPHTSFSLTSGERRLFQTGGDGSLPHILGDIHGLECAKALLSLDYRSSTFPVEISGSLSAPYYHRPSRRGITVIVNGRVVKAPPLVYALERGYGDLLPRGRYPVAVIRIQLPPDLLDVNVHPSKATVRFRNQATLTDLLYRAVRQVLGKQLPLPRPQHPAKVGDTGGETAETDGGLSGNRPIYPPTGGLETFSRGNNRSLQPLSLREGWGEPKPRERPLDTSPTVGGKTGRGQFKLIGQFLHSYIVAQRDEELMVIDQHAAHERVLYHKLLSETVSQGVQLTLPLEVEIPLSWRERFSGMLGILEELGFKLEPFGDNNYIIRHLPVLLKGEISSGDIHDLIHKLLSEEPEPGLSKREQICRGIACQKAIKAKQALSRPEMEALLEEWPAVPGYQYCPHGRPSILSFSRHELDKVFRRKGGR